MIGIKLKYLKSTVFVNILRCAKRFALPKNKIGCALARPYHWLKYFPLPVRNFFLRVVIIGWKLAVWVSSQSDGAQRRTLSCYRHTDRYTDTRFSKGASSGSLRASHAASQDSVRKLRGLVFAAIQFRI